MHPYRTRSGRVLSEAELDGLVAEAERGYYTYGPWEYQVDQAHDRLVRKVLVSTAVLFFALGRLTKR